jgi:hypothetical protein
VRCNLPPTRAVLIAFAIGVALPFNVAAQTGNVRIEVQANQQPVDAATVVVNGVTSLTNPQNSVLRVVVDANVYVSALIRPQGPPGQILTQFLENAFEIVLSPAIVEETVRAFAYPRVRKYIHAAVDPELWFEDVILLAQFVAAAK